MNTMVDRIIRNGGQVLGVEVTSTDFTGKIMLKPSGRLILSAGAFGTPKILFRSGIGPTDMLNIVAASSDGPKMISRSEWINLPVGYNLSDHTNTNIVISHPSIKPYDFSAAFNSPIPTDKANYLSNRSGPFAGAGSAPYTVAWKIIPGSVDNIPRQLQWTVGIYSTMGATGDHIFVVAMYLGTGQTSRGRLGIDSSLKTSVIKSPYRQTEGDIQAIIKGVDSFITAAKKVPEVTFIFPNPSQTAEQYVRTYNGNLGVNHWMGSCQMGKHDGRKGSGDVVDYNTKVYGTKNLFIIDASISPGQTTCNPSAAFMIMAERAVERILAL